jgi:hypothetical protein
MRWNLKLSELDFVVEHRAGYKIGRVDALSRQAGAVIHDVILNKENIFREQAKKAFCRIQKTWRLP